MTWQTIPQEEAQKHPYYGFGGWLLVLYLLTLLSTVMLLLQAFVLPEPPAAAALEGRPGAMRTIHVAYAAIWIPFLVIAPLKHPQTPRVWLGCIWGNAAVYITSTSLIAPISQMLVPISVNLLISVAVTWYVLSSKRVNVTYLNRVSAENRAG